MAKSPNALQKHLQEEHSVSPFSRYLQEIVYGGNDGIITTFAVVAGFAGAQSTANSELTYLAVLLFGLANLFADATSMGLGNVLSMRAEQDRYDQERSKEQHEIINNPEMEKAESIEILISKGFSADQAKILVDIYSQNKNYWIDFMMKYELGMTDPSGENPWLTGLATFISFIVFGAIPLIPYFIFRDGANTFMYAVGFAAVALILLGILRWKVTRISFWRSIGEVLLLGGIAAVIAYFVGTRFK